MPNTKPLAVGEGDRGRWWHYVRVVTNDAPQNLIAASIDAHESAISRWKSGAQPSSKLVVKFARAHRRNVLEALVIAGYITGEEAGQPPPPLVEYSTDELMDEVFKRRQVAQRKNPPSPDSV